MLATLQPNGSGGEFTQFHHPDRLGTRLITNAQDATYQEQVSLPYGTALNAESTGSTNRRFTSYDRSASTGLDYAVNRHYDSSQGRFTQVDPIGMGAANLSNPQSMNLYAYCGNDPINHLDPRGLFWGKLWRGIKKILTNKWVRLAIAVALTVLLANPSSLIITNFTTGAITGVSTLGYVAVGLSGALSVGTFLQGQQEEKPKDAADVGGCGGSEDNPCVYKLPGGKARIWISSIADALLNGVSVVGKFIKEHPEILLLLIPLVGGWIGRGIIWGIRLYRAYRDATTLTPVVTENTTGNILTAAERAELQRIADKYNTTIDVVGSRAAGNGRNIGTNLPVGKGPSTRSDIDVRIDGDLDISTRGALSDELKNIGGGGLVNVSTRLPSGSFAPVIRITPKGP